MSILAIALPLVTPPSTSCSGCSGCPQPCPPAATGRFAPPPWDRSSPQWQQLDRDLPADHLARRIDQAVDQLNLTDLFGAYAGKGSLPYRPDLLLKVVLFEMRRGRHSPDEWFQDLREHTPCQWLAWGIRPARSRLYAFRERLGAHLDAWHQQLMHLALDEGITTAQNAALDGSTVAANSSRHRLLNQATLDKRQTLLAQANDAQPQEADTAGTCCSASTGDAAARPTTPLPATSPAGPESATPPSPPQPSGAAPPPEGPSPSVEQASTPRPGWMAPTPEGQKRQAKNYQKAHEHLKQRQAENRQRPAGKRKAEQDVRVSLGDPEAALGLDKLKVFRPLYNVQLMPDLDSPLILAYEVFAQATDSGTLEPMLERCKQATGHNVKNLAADASYATALDAAACAKRQVTLYAPYQQNDFTAAKRASKPAAYLPKESFVWLAQEQTYQCPAGHRLKLDSQENKKRQGGQKVRVFTYRCPAEHCRACPRRQQCTRSPQRGRTIDRSEHEELIEALQQRMHTSEAKQLYKRRGQTVELCFADSKEHRQLRQLSGRGRKRARIEVGLLVLSHNALEVLAARTEKASPQPSANPEIVPT